MTVERGQKIGAEYIVDEWTGVLREFEAVHYGNIFFGGVHGWDREGNLREETFYPQPDAARVRRTWDADGRLVSEGAIPSRDTLNGSYAAVFGDHDPPEHPAFTHLWRIDRDEAEERYVSGGKPYWGFLTTAEDGGRGRVRLVLDGREEGPVLATSPVSPSMRPESHPGRVYFWFGPVATYLGQWPTRQSNGMSTNAARSCSMTARPKAASSRAKTPSHIGVVASARKGRRKANMPSGHDTYGRSWTQLLIRNRRDRASRRGRLRGSALTLSSSVRSVRMRPPQDIMVCAHQGPVHLSPDSRLGATDP
ncbi:hypothetical protein [Nocardiopsis salina]|uniref:hypothetical protein n=1 Tax=Nocardiopsis salina TaxID=245836 RepID=UPI00034792FD|nr:hypothetical protein [Nocardiopsis salina]